jgi:hypothetical protein
LKRYNIELNIEAENKYKGWGHHKSEHTSKAILAYEPYSKSEDSITKSEAEEILKPIIERIKALEERKGKK